MDGTVLTFTLGLAVLGVVVGVAPAVQLARVNLSNVLREDGRTGTAGRGARATFAAAWSCRRSRWPSCC